MATKIRSNTPLVKILEVIQKRRPHESCDTHLVCMDGYVPCHRYILSSNSPFLKNLIADNLRDMGGHADNKSIISISFPDVKTHIMAHIVAMFYGGYTICKLDDLYYVMSVLKLIGIDLSSQNNLHPALPEEINAFCRPRYYIDPDSDSDAEEVTVHEKYTTNAFAGLQPPVPQSSKGSSKVSKPEIPVENRMEDNNSNNDYAESRVDDLIEEIDDPVDMDVDVDIPEESPVVPEVPVENPQPKVTPISIKALMNKKTKKRGRRPTLRKESEAQDVPRSTNVSSKAKDSVEVPEKKNGKVNSDPDPKLSSESEGDDDGESSASGDSLVRGVDRRSNLRSRPSKKEPEPTQPTRHTPLRKCRKETEDTSSTVAVSLPSAPETDKESISTKKKRKQVIFSFTDSEEDDKKPPEVKCFFCSKIFASEPVLAKHLSKECGKHLTGKYSSSKKKCLVCNKSFNTLNLWGLIRHVSVCHTYRSPNQGTSVVADTSVPAAPSAATTAPSAPSAAPSSATNVASDLSKESPKGRKKAKRRHSSDKRKSDKAKKKPDVAAKSKPDSDDDVCSDEEIQVVDSLKVAVIRVVDIKNKNLKTKANDLQSASETPPPPPPETVPEPSSSQQPNLEPKKCDKKIAAPTINRSGPATVKNILTAINELRDCKFCTKAHDNISGATSCLSGHGYTMCWICFLTYDVPIEPHYLEKHEMTNKPGYVACPHCKSSFKPGSLHRHMNDIHFSRTTTSHSVQVKHHVATTSENKSVNTNVPTEPILPIAISCDEVEIRVVVPEVVSFEENSRADRGKNTNKNQLKSVTKKKSKKDIDDEIIDWAEIDNDIEDYRRRKALAAAEKEKAVAEKALESHKEPQGRQEVISTVAIPATTSVQPFAPQMEGAPKPKLPFSPALIASRFRREWNEENGVQTSSTPNVVSVIQDGNEPSTSRAAMSSFIPRRQDPLLNYSQSSNHLPLRIPKIPALDSRFSGERAIAPVSGAPNTFQQVRRPVQDMVPHGLVPRSPHPGDRLYCGTIKVGEQNYKMFKMPAGEATASPLALTGTESQASNYNPSEQNAIQSDPREDNEEMPIINQE